MTQPPAGAGGLPGHPEPEPIPSPEPDPPQPIPPPEPPLPPEPPHAQATQEQATQEQAPHEQATQEQAPHEQAPHEQAPHEQAPHEQAPHEQAPHEQAPHEQAPHERTRPTVSIAAAEGPADDFIDAAPPTDEVQWPPVGAYPGEPGHTGETEVLTPVAAMSEQPTVAATIDDQPTVWQQPVPTDPWHAQHEKPGEWKYEPPEHLAFQHSPPAEMQDPTQQIPLPSVEQPWQIPLTTDEPPRRRRTGLWVSLALTVTLLLCGGGAVSAFLILRNANSGGAPDPATAVNDFMTAVYTQQDASAADELVCREARDSDRLAARVNQIKGYSTEYEAPAFRWSEPAVSAQTDERATVTVQLTMSTDDEKSAQQQLTFTTVRKTNWLVCEITG